MHQDTVSSHIFNDLHKKMKKKKITPQFLEEAVTEYSKKERSNNPRTHLHPLYPTKLSPSSHPSP